MFVKNQKHLNQWKEGQARYLKYLGNLLLITEEQAKAFNDAAVKVMKANGIEINDLYAAISADRAKYTRGKADVHWNQAGSVLLGKQVAKSILSVIKGR